VGEPGIGKTRLAQEATELALARGGAVAWGRCLEVEGAPPFWPWPRVLRSVGVDPDTVLTGQVESPGERFRLFEDVSVALQEAAQRANGLLVVLDDIHWADEPALLVLRHLTDQIRSMPLLLVATCRDVEPDSILPRVLPDLLRSPAVERVDLRGFDLSEVREQLSGMNVDDSAADGVLQVTAGNPLFVREVASAMADGTWRPERPPRSVLDVVGARLSRLSAGSRRLLQAAAIVGRDFPLQLVAATLDTPMPPCLPLVDEAIGYGLVDRVGDTDDYRFVHALTRDAVEASLSTADRVALHRAVADAIGVLFADDMTEHVADLARHWARLAPYGEAATARTWAIRAAEHAVRHLAYEEGVRLYRTALAFAAPLPDAQRCRVLVALGRAAYLAGGLQSCVAAATAAADTARAAGSAELMAEAGLVLEPAMAEHTVNAVAKQLCEEALAALGDTDHDTDHRTAGKALRARLLAQRSQLAFYDGDRDHVAQSSAAALELARESRDDRALVDALRAREQACPKPAGRAERLLLAAEMLALAHRTNNARTAMWGTLWRIDALIEGGQLPAAAEELGALEVYVRRVGGPVSAWYLDRVRALLAQAQGRFAEAIAASGRAFERMRAVELGAARGTHFAQHCALAHHVGVTQVGATFVQHPFDLPLHHATLGRLHRASLLLRAGRPDEAAGCYQQAGPPTAWALPAFIGLVGHVVGALVAAELGRLDDLAVLLDRLAPFHGEHTSAGVIYLGPVDLCLGRGAAALGHLDRAVNYLAAAVEQADRAAAPGFAAEARYHLAMALLARDRPGDRLRAEPAARHADRLAKALGMAAYTDRTATLVAHLDRIGRPSELSAREAEVARLVAEGLTNRQIAQRLVISERTAENHVQHILTKLGFTTRSQIAAWSTSTRR
jgi:DNA-binding CsgD family transcriptional regulator